MQFMITAWDGKDAEALARRLNVRESHLENIAKIDAAGHFIKGGAILDDAGKMIGSTVYVDFDDMTALRAWLDNDPYVTGKVWQEIDIHPIKLLP